MWALFIALIFIGTGLCLTFSYDTFGRDNSVPCIVIGAFITAMGLLIVIFLVPNIPDYVSYEEVDAPNFVAVRGKTTAFVEVGNLTAEFKDADRYNRSIQVNHIYIRDEHSLYGNVIERRITLDKY